MISGPIRSKNNACVPHMVTNHWQLFSPQSGISLILNNSESVFDATVNFRNMMSVLLCLLRYPLDFHLLLHNSTGHL
jgi:hypothetical protein